MNTPKHTIILQTTTEHPKIDENAPIIKAFPVESSKKKQIVRDFLPDFQCHILSGKPTITECHTISCDKISVKSQHDNVDVI